jgi:cytochrome c2
MGNFSWFGLGPFAVAGLIASSAPAFAGGDAAKGAIAFNKCRACHSLEPGRNGVGPSLAGSIGRQSASVPGYAYSSGMKNVNITWTEENLDVWLSSPRAMVPNTKMTFLGMSSPEERADLIAFLKSK